MIQAYYTEDLERENLSKEDREIVEKIYNMGFGKLTFEEQTKALIRYKETESKVIFDAIVNMNEGLVLKIADKYKDMTDFEDILQEGRIALMAAVRKFDVTKNCRFSTYACHYIFGYITRYVENSSFIHYPADVVREIQDYLKTASSNPMDDTKQIAKKLRQSEERILEIKKYVSGIRPASLNAYMNDDEEDELISFIPAQTPTPEEIIQKKATKDIVRTQIRKFSNTRKQEIMLKKAFGIDENPMTTRDIAEEFGLSHSGASASTGKLIKKMQNNRRQIRRELDIPSDVSDIEVTSYIFHDER